MVTALLVRLFFFGFILVTSGEDGFLVNDSSRSLRVAENLVLGNGFSQSKDVPYLPAADFPPFYPLLLAVSNGLTGSFLPVIFLQMVVSSLLPYLIFHMGDFLSLSIRVRNLAAFLTAFEPQMILWSLFVITEVTAVSLLLFSLFCFLRWFYEEKTRYLGMTALFLGFSTLTRPHGQFLFILALVFLLIFVWRKRKIIFARQAVVFALIFLAVVGPWILRNYVQFGTVSIASTGLRNIYSDFANSVLQVHTGKSFNEIREELYLELAKKYNTSPEEVFRSPEYGREIAKEGLRIILDHPSATLKVIFISEQAFFTQDLYLDYARRLGLIPYFSFGFSPSLVLSQDGVGELVRLIKERIGFYALIPIIGRFLWVSVDILALLGVVYAWRQGGSRFYAAIFFSVIILYFAGVSLVGGFADQGRLRYPVNTLLFLLAGVGLSSFVSGYKKYVAVSMSK